MAVFTLNKQYDKILT